MYTVKKKGGKVFAPKIPVRRPGATSSTPSSARPSVERQSQTPVPQTLPETVTIRDSETPDPTYDPSTTTPHQPPVEKAQDAPPRIQSILEASAQNDLAHAQNRALVTDKESLKRKSRDYEAGSGVEGPQKRRQPPGLDVPRTPPQPSPIQQPLATRASPQSARPTEIAQQATPKPSQPPSEQPSNAVAAARDDNPAVETSSRATLETVEPSQSISPAPEIAAGPSSRRPLPESRSIVQPSHPTSQAIDISATSISRRPLPDRILNAPASEPTQTEVPVPSLGSAGATSGLGAAGDLGASRAGGGQLAQTPVIAPLNPDGTPGQAVRQPATGTKKKAPKRRTIQDPENEDNVRPTIEMHLNRPRRPQGQKKSRNRKERAKKDGKRAETPEGAEGQKIDAEAMTMRDMCKDLRVGKKFSKHDELRQREKQKILKAKLAKHPELAQLMDDSEDGGNGEGASAPATAPAVPEAEPETEPVRAGGPQMRIVDDQIVMDESSLQFDRRRNAHANEATLEQVVENEFSKVVTCGTHMKREKAQLWDMAANETFYKGLKMFGTDFEMIAGLFPHRNRRQIKLKFCKEEKDNPRRIDKVLKGAGSSIELDTYEKLSGRKLESVEEIEAERLRIEAEQKAEENKRLAELAEIEKKKRGEILAKNAERAAATKRVFDAAGISGDEAQVGEKENRPKQAPKMSRQAMNKRKKQQAAAEETVVVLGDA